MNLRLTKNATDAMNASASCARQLGHDHIGSEHILLSILAIPQSQAVKRFRSMGLDPAELSESLRQTVSGAVSDAVLQRGPLPLSSRTRKVLEIAALEAGKDAPVGTVHLVQAMLKEGENAAAQLLFNAGVRRTLARRTQPRPPRASPARPRGTARARRSTARTARRRRPRPSTPSGATSPTSRARASSIR